MQNSNNGNQNLIRQNSVSPLERIELVSGFTDFGMPFGPQKHLREYIRLLMKRKWVIIGCVVTAGAIALIYNFRQTPIYQATAQLEIDMETNDILPYQDFNNSEFNYYEYDEFLKTQIKHITSRNLAERIARVAGLDQEVPEEPQEEEKSVLSSLWNWITGSQTPEEESKPLTRDQMMEMAIGEVQGGLFVNPMKDSRVVEIGFSSPDPERATLIVNAAIDEYIEYNFEAKVEATSRATEFLKKQLVDLKAKVEESEKALIEYARKKNILSLGCCHTNPGGPQQPIERSKRRSHGKGIHLQNNGKHRRRQLSPSPAHSADGTTGAPIAGRRTETGGDDSPVGTGHAPGKDASEPCGTGERTVGERKEPLH
jgi:capsular polysaccharide biosynthesis protein